MNTRHPMGTLHLFSIKNIFYDKMDLKHFLFSCGKIRFFIVNWEMKFSIKDLFSECDQIRNFPKKSFMKNFIF